MRWLILILAALLAAVTLMGCNDVPEPRKGTAAAGAASAQARAAVAATAADDAGRVAVDLLGDAAAAEELARLTGLQEDIDKAVAARVQAARAEAVHEASLAQEALLQAAADEAAKKAEQERQTEQTAQDYRSWVRLCRLVGSAGILGGFLVFAVMAWATKTLTAGRWPGLILAGAGALVITLGPATAWMPWLVAVAAAVAVAWWAIGHRLDRLARERARAAAIAGSRAIDATEKMPIDQAKAAKKAFADHLQAAGVADEVKALRGSDRLWSCLP